MIAMVSSNLAELMGGTRPQTSQQLFEITKQGAELTGPGQPSSAQCDSENTENEANTTRATG